MPGCKKWDFNEVVIVDCFCYLKFDVPATLVQQVDMVSII